ncbi:hypothetical protein ACA910_001115 [Epithemia clementina (nom. ined.)]
MMGAWLPTATRHFCAFPPSSGRTRQHDLLAAMISKRRANVPCFGRCGVEIGCRAIASTTTPWLISNRHHVYKTTKTPQHCCFFSTVDRIRIFHRHPYCRQQQSRPFGPLLLFSTRTQTTISTTTHRRAHSSYSYHEYNHQPQDTTTTAARTTTTIADDDEDALFFLQKSSSEAPDFLQSNQFVSRGGQLIGRIQTLNDLVKAVEELELMPSLVREDHDGLIKPLLSVCKVLIHKNSNKDPRVVADLAERILLNCLARLSDGSRSNPEEEHDSSSLSMSTMADAAAVANKKHRPLFPDIEDYNMVCLICGSLRSIDGAQKVERWRQLMTELHEKEQQQLKATEKQDQPHARFATTTTTTRTSAFHGNCSAPNLETFKLLSRAWALSGTYDGVVRAEIILVEQMEGWTETRSDSRLEQDLLSSSSSTLEEQEQQQEQERPTRDIYTTILYAYSRFTASEPEALERAKALFQRMRNLEHIDMDFFCLYAMLYCYRNYVSSDHFALWLPEKNQQQQEQDAKLLEEIESLLRECQQPQQDEVEPSLERQLLSEGHSAHSWAVRVLVEAILRLLEIRMDDSVVEQYLRRAHQAVLSLNELKEFVYDENIPRTGAGFRRKAVPLIHRNHDVIISLYQAWTTSSASDRAERLKELWDMALSTRYELPSQCNSNLEQWRDSGLDDSPLLMQQILSSLSKRQQHESFNSAANNNIKGETLALVMTAWRQSRYDEAPQWNEQNLQYMKESNIPIKNLHLRLVLESWLRFCESGERHDGFHGQGLLAAEHISEHLKQKQVWDTWNPKVLQVALDAWALQTLLPSDRQNNPLYCLENAWSMLRASRSRSSRKKFSAAHCNAVLRCCIRVFDENNHPSNHHNDMMPSTDIGTSQNNDNKNSAKNNVAASPKIFQKAFQMALRLYEQDEGKRDWQTFVLLARIANAARAVHAASWSDIHRWMESIFCEAKDVCLVSQELVWEMALAGPHALQRLFLLSPMEAMQVEKLQQQGQDDDSFWKKHTFVSELLCLRNLPSNWSNNLLESGQEEQNALKAVFWQRLTSSTAVDRSVVLNSK